MTVFSEKLGHNVGRPTASQAAAKPPAAQAPERERRNMRKRTREARETYLAAEEGFRAWRSTLPAAGLGPLTASEAYALYTAFEASRSHEPMALRAFGIRARAAFGASANRKRRTIYANVAGPDEGAGREGARQEA
jgi:hypothetical protein